MNASPPSGRRSRAHTWIPDFRVCAVLLLWLGSALAILSGAEPPGSVAGAIARQLEEGKVPGWKLDTVTGIYWGAVANVMIALALLVSMRWWAAGAADNGESATGAPAPARASSGAAFHAALIALVLLGGALRWNLAHGSLWWDELWNVKMATVGEFRTGSRHPGEERFYATDFARCAWYYQKPTNHVPTALASKLGHLLWARATAAKDGAFDEFVIRLPVLACALASIFMTGICGRRWAGSGTGLSGAFLLAVHPWFIRYGVDARAYCPLVLCTLVALWALHRALAGNLWRHWAAFGMAQFLLMWSHLHAIWFCGAMTLAAAVLLLRRRAQDGHGHPSPGRLIAVNALAAGAFLQVFLPNLLQLRRWAGGENIDGSVLDGEMSCSTLSLFLFGIEPRWKAQSPEADGLVSWDGMTGGNPWIMWLAILAALGLGIAGFHALHRKDRTAFFLLTSILGGAATFFVAARVLHLYFYPRFAIPLLPATVIALAAGTWHCGEWLGRLVGNKALGARACAAMAAAVFTLVCLPQIRVLQTRSYAPMREVAAFLSRRHSESGGMTIALGYGLGGRILKVYRPQVQYVLEPPADQALRKQLDAARNGGKSLYVFYGYPAFNRSVLPEGFQLLDDPSLFEEVAAFPGIEPEFYFRILRARLP